MTGCGVRRQERRLEPSVDHQQSLPVTHVHAGKQHRAGVFPSSLASPAVVQRMDLPPSIAEPLSIQTSLAGLSMPCIWSACVIAAAVSLLASQPSCAQPPSVSLLYQEG